MGAAGSPPPELPAPESIMARAGVENFTVASRLLPRATRENLQAIYGFARLVDEIGDALPGERSAALDWLEAELRAAFEGCAQHPLLRRLQRTIGSRGLRPEPFQRLIEANRLDQRKQRYASFAELRAYCRLSADPVGELVLSVFNRASAENVALSDRICTALQLVEHLQDVREDLERGRIYLPSGELAGFGLSERDLTQAPAGEALQALIAFQADRARRLLFEGEPLLGRLHGSARLAIAAYAAGGHAALDALAAASFDVCSGAPEAGSSDRARWMARLLWNAAMSRRAGCDWADDAAGERSRGAGAVDAVGDAAGVAREGAAPAATIAALRSCEAITRREAANFYYGIRLLPPAQRSALSVIYAFARHVDDIGDGPLPVRSKLLALDRLQGRLAEMGFAPAGPDAVRGEPDAVRGEPVVSVTDRAAAGRPHMRADGALTPGGRAQVEPQPAVAYDLAAEPLLEALGAVAGRYDLPGDALHELIEGMRMDVHEESYVSERQLILYCRRVAGTIGRLALAIYGVRNERAGGWAPQAASDLGVAMQITNILRDLREDAERGRLYLPREHLARFSLDSEGDAAQRARHLLARGAAGGGLGELIAYEVAGARDWFVRGNSLIGQLDRRSAACVLSMSGIYQQLLARISADPEIVLKGRIALSVAGKARTALLSVARALA